MPFVPTFDDVSPAIRTALEGHGFTAFTPVQEAVLDPELAGRDLRIFSQTGSGKTVAVGLAIATNLEAIVAARASAPAGPTGKPAPARPFALMVAPTRELATQIANELSWLFTPLGVHVTSVTGGASYTRELTALRRGPLVVAGTPGRLLDHLARKSIDPSGLGVVVLDEADQMLDLGFKDELDAILAQTPETRRTLLLSATFPREVQRLADRCQKDPIVAAGAGAGERHMDIGHIAHIVLGEERERALVNLLLMAPGERALVFVRTRDGAADLADRLSDRGLPARAIHGDLEQRDRTRTLDAFRSGAVMTLVATDVAARGLDVPDVMRVIHADPPGDSEVLTHRSGRTGRAGKKGTSIVLVPPGMRERVRAMLRRAGVDAVWSPAPSAADVLRAADERLAAELSGVTTPPDPRLLALADKLLPGRDVRELVALLLARAEHTGPCAPADVTSIMPPTSRAAQTMPPPGRDNGHDKGRRGRPGAHGDARSSGGGGNGGTSYVPFRINWGERQGADPRRLLALVCRRGGIRGSEVGAIRIGFAGSTFEVAAPVAEGFARSVREPDTRDPRIHITPVNESRGSAPPARGDRPAPAVQREKPAQARQDEPPPQAPRPEKPPEATQHEKPAKAQPHEPPRAPQPERPPQAPRRDKPAHAPQHRESPPRAQAPQGGKPPRTPYRDKPSHAPVASKKPAAKGFAPPKRRVVVER